LNLKEKSRVTAAVLTVLFGPLGLFYSSAAGAIVLVIVVLITAGTVVGPFLCWAASIYWGEYRVRRHNESIALLLGRHNGDEE